MLNKSFRLPAQTEFKHAQKLHTEFLFIKYQKNDLKVSRFGFVISKAISKSAVDRNRIKRRIRNVIERNIVKMPTGYDMLFIIKKFLNENEKAETDTLVKLISSINK